MKKLRTSPPMVAGVSPGNNGFSRQTLERFASERRYEQNLKWQR